MKAAGPGGQPNFLQGFLQIDDDLAAVFKRQGHHAAGALVVNVGIRFIVDPVAGYFHCLQGSFGVAEVFQVAHYNPIMFASLQIHGQILGRRALSVRPQGLATIGCVALLLASLAACGQKGPLFLPKPLPPLQTQLPAASVIAPVNAPAQAIPEAPNRPASTHP